jgi:peptide chain release factor 2
LISQPGFFQNEEGSKKTLGELKRLKSVAGAWSEANNKLNDLKEISSILQDSDQDLLNQLETNTKSLVACVGALEFKTLFSGEFDANNAILSINAGAGGTESCDWVKMLLRMYVRFSESKGYSVKTIDILEGEETGIKNVTLLINGDYAYGYLKAERGVHRLVRISPYDANKRRHTTFASVDVIPEVEDDVDIVIGEKDLRVDVYRSSGAGGQSVNTTDSAVRITHLPTGIVVSCQNERSQFQNKQNALKVLKARLYEKTLLDKEEKLQKESSEKRKIEWGSQIRSYVLHPYNMVKDHRTDYETGDTQHVLDGGLDEFIEVFLKLKGNSKNA